MMETDEASEMFGQQSTEEPAFLPPPYTYQEMSPPVTPVIEGAENNDTLSRDFLRLNRSRLESTDTEMKVSHFPPSHLIK